MLARLGHGVVEAPSLEEAKARFEEARSELGLVLSDVSSGPGSSGAELIEWVGSRRPEVTVVLMSGYDSLLATLLVERGHDFLQKPLRLEELAALPGRRLGGRG